MLKRLVSPDDVIDLSKVLTALISEIVSSSSTLQHIDSNRILVCIGQNKQGRGGLYGKLVPLRFKHGSEVLKYQGKFYTIPEVSNNGTAYLYIIYFYMPRFFDLSVEEKLRVIFHELYHISPLFNGDIRRMGAVKAAHGHSKKHFDSLYRNELHSFIEYVQPTKYKDFLQMNSSSLFRLYKQVTAINMRSPKPVIVD